MEKTHIIIDTDIGDDVDDALAIAVALMSPEIEIEGITTVFKDVRRRAKQVKNILSKFGADKIPVFEGCASPVKGETDETELPILWSEEDEIEYTPKETSGVDFIIQTLRKNPDTILVAIGPMTNVALAVRKAPDVMKHASVYAMGGAFDSAFAEYNIVCDPEATEIVLNHISNIKLFGLEQTCKVWLEDAVIEEINRSENPGVRLIGRMMNDFVKRRGFKVYMHDLFPLCGILYPEAFRFDPKKLWVELEGKRTRGTIIVDADYFRNQENVPNAEIAAIEDADLIRRVFMSRLTEKKWT